MAWGGVHSAPTRLAKPTHEEWVPHDYQRRAVDFLLANNEGALFLEPGLGKTSIVLAAFTALKTTHPRAKMLVVAPLRVCQLVWRQEGARWTQFRGLKFSLLHGSKKDKALREDADIYLVNPEGVAWLAKACAKHWPFDVLTIDELTKFKNAGAARSKQLAKFAPLCSRRYGLTGTPTPNGYEDLFGQMKILDGGKALGRFKSHFLDMYFKRGFNGFDWDLQTGGAERIENRIRHMTLRMSAEEYLQLPQLIQVTRQIEFDEKSAKTYRQMKDEMLVDLPEGEVSASNAGAVYSKLSQLANGAVYLPQGVGEKRTYAKVHDLKLDDLEDLLDELSGQPLLIGYEFESDMLRLQERFGERIVFATGASEKRITEIERQWNAGEIAALAVHPASMGHGLNFQRGGAQHLAWMSRPWDYELYEQLLKRLLRQGNPSDKVFEHSQVVRGTIDEIKVADNRTKGDTQAQFLQRLSNHLRNEDTEETTPMTVQVQRLGHQASAAPAAGGWGPAPTPQPVAATHVAPAAVTGWGPQPTAAPSPAPQPATGGWGPATGAAPQPTQQDAIVARITPAPQPAQDQTREPDPQPATGGMGYFSPAIQQAVVGVDSQPVPDAQPAAAEKPKRTRKPTAETKGEDAEQVQEDPHRFAPNTLTSADFARPVADPKEARIDINIHGTASQIRAALRALLG